MRPTIEKLWPLIGWGAVIVGFPFHLEFVVATGAAIATVGYVLRIDRVVRPSANTKGHAR